MLARACLRPLGSGLNFLRDWSHVIHGKCAPRKLATHQSNKIDSAETMRLQSVFMNPLEDQAPFTVDKEQEMFITEGDPGKYMKLQELLLKFYVKRQEGFDLPTEVKVEDLAVMMNLGNVQLAKMLRYLRKCQYMQIKRIKEKEDYAKKLAEVREGRTENLANLEHPWLEYCLHMNSLCPRIFKGSMHRLYDAHAGVALLHGQEVILDCSFESHMDDLRIKQTAKQILFCFTMNRKSRRPFSLHLCNVDYKSRLVHYIHRMHPNFLTDSPIGVHTSSYLDHFDRKRLVYLTPHTEETLQYNPNDIYILGGMVDRLQGLQLTNKKAAKENIRSASLPLKQYLTWKQGGKSLCIHQAFGALLTVKDTGDWKRALLEHVPSRKIQDMNEILES